MCEILGYLLLCSFSNIVTENLDTLTANLEPCFVTGKTVAFMLPILERLLYKPKQAPVTRVLILVPTRELAVQVHTVSKQLANYTNIDIALSAGNVIIIVMIILIDLFIPRHRIVMVYYGFRLVVHVFIHGWSIHLSIFSFPDDNLSKYQYFTKLGYVL